MPTSNRVTGIALIAEKLQENTGITNRKKCAKLVKEVCEAITDVLVENGEAKVKGFFTFKLKNKPGRVYIVPQGKGEVEKPAYTSLRVQPHAYLIEKINTR